MEVTWYGRTCIRLRGKDAVVVADPYQSVVGPTGRGITGDIVVFSHPDDRPLWELTHGDELWDVDLSDGFTIDVAGTTLQVLHTPGHAPGAVCFHAPALGCLFTGDTLFNGGPGATGRSYSDKPTLLASIRTRLLDLPEGTVVHTGHGDDTTIGAERAGIGTDGPA